LQTLLFLIRNSKPLFHTASSFSCISLFVRVLTNLSKLSLCTENIGNLLSIWPPTFNLSSLFQFDVLLPIFHKRITSYRMSSQNPFCPKTGRGHSEYPSTYSFCPECRISLQGQITSVPVREKPELIVIEDSPQQPAKPALFLPSASTQSHRTKPPPSDAWLKAQSRIAAAEARQQSIQRTTQGKPRVGVLSKEKEFPVIVSIYIIPTWYEDEGFGIRFRESPPYRTLLLLFWFKFTNIS
jgi:hypothetical protein